MVTDLYTKQTDTQLLHRSSCHPYHTKKGIPYGQALRIRRICSEDSFFDERMRDLKSWLIGRGYHEGEIDSQLDKVRQLDREILLNGISKQKDDTRIQLVLTYHPALHGVSNILQKCVNILLVDDEQRKQFAGKVFVSLRRAKNLKDTLVRAKLQPQDRELVPKGSFKCSGKRCQICPIIQEGCSFSNANDSRSFKNFSGAYDCNSTNVVYMLQCTCCNKKYVGSTKNFVKDLTCTNHTFGLTNRSVMLVFLIRERWCLRQAFSLIFSRKATMVNFRSLFASLTEHRMCIPFAGRSFFGNTNWVCLHQMA